MPYRITKQMLESSLLDKVAPTAPYPVIVQEVSSTTATLSWEVADRNDVHRFEIYRDGLLVGTSVISKFRNTGLKPDTAYVYKVRAVDVAGNRSLFSLNAYALTKSANAQDLQVLEPRKGMIYGDVVTVRAQMNHPNLHRLDVYYAAADRAFSDIPTQSQLANQDLFLLSLPHQSNQAKIRLVARDLNGQQIAIKDVIGIGRKTLNVDITQYGKQLQDGATVIKNEIGDIIGSRFVMWSKHAERAQLWIYGYGDNGDGRPLKIVELVKQNSLVLDGYLWVAEIYDDAGLDVSSGLLYGYRVWGPNFKVDTEWRPGTLAGFLADIDVLGNRFNPNKLLIDPYARTMNKDPNLSKPEFSSGAGKRELDSAGLAPKSIVYDPTLYEWGTHFKPNISMQDTIIYETHVRGYTKDQSSGVKYPGTFKGFVEKLDHISELGVTAVELLPIHETVNDDFLGKNKNYWGYMTVNYFSPDRRYSSDQSAFGPIHEFKDYVKTLHAAGKEVFLDVVYNHTAEGGSNKSDPSVSTILSMRGIDNQSYYSLSADRQSFYDNTGCCGANFNVVSAKGQQFIIDSLRYWVDEMKVDGFRFDLSSILGNKVEHGGFQFSKTRLLKRIYQEFPNVKLIAEPWAINDDTYQVGNHPGSVTAGENAWSEWQDKFRQTIRYALRGDTGKVVDFATRVTGSSDLYEDDGRRPYNSINYVVSHDGYTLNDLFSYNSSDGWDSGGSDTIRRQLIRNAFVFMAISAGTPMILGGDEMRRTQQGNKNAYNQDNPISWYNWHMKSHHRRTFDFAKGILQLRKGHPVFRRSTFFTGKDQSGDGLPDIQWHGTQYKLPDWTASSKTLAWRLDGSKSETKATADDQDFYVIVNHDSVEQSFQLPPNRAGKKWRRVVDSAAWAENNSAIVNNIEVPGQEDRISDGTWTSLTANSFAGNTSYVYKANPRSVVIFLER
jgi:glycogen operon protein